jgi:hypothetical protein
MGSVMQTKVGTQVKVCESEVTVIIETTAVAPAKELPHFTTASAVR